MSAKGTPLEINPVHLGLGATARAQPAFGDPMEWYADYEARSESDGAEGRLVSAYEFSEAWTMWEMHPLGDEVVICTEGEMTLIQELSNGALRRTSLRAGQYAINPRGVWHTADVPQCAAAIFITAGKGTQHRPR